MDQAEQLRNIIKKQNMQQHLARVITVTSGKGGVGKSNVSVNLALQLSRLNKRVVILDADFGLANVEILMGIRPKYNLADLLFRGKTLREVICPRDIEDAITLGILDKKLKELHEVLKLDKDVKINNTVILNMFIKDLCENSSLENGLCFSDEKFEMLNNLKEFNYKNIYLSEKTLGSVDYFELVLNKLFWFLSRMNFRDDDMKKICPVLADDFNKWLKEFFSLARPLPESL